MERSTAQKHSIYSTQKVKSKQQGSELKVVDGWNGMVCCIVWKGWLAGWEMLGILYNILCDMKRNFRAKKYFWGKRKGKRNKRNDTIRNEPR